MYILGIDAGSVAVSACLVDQNGDAVKWDYALHHGAVRETLEKLLAGFDPADVAAVAATTSTPSFVRAHRRVDGYVAACEAAKHFNGDPGTVLVVGGEHFFAATMDPEGGPPRFAGNTSCAAGTGGFLDQQAERLGLADAGELAARALENTEEAPRIATRCAVFAKTDLAHAQQQGASLSAVADGLCRGLAKNIADTLFGGEKPREPLILAGGVSRNAAVASHLADILGLPVESTGGVPYGAAGAALVLLAEGASRGSAPGSWDSILETTEAVRSYHHEPLDLACGEYPDFADHEHYLHDPAEAWAGGPVEVDAYADPPASGGMYLGVDVGSTSTKVMVTDADGAPVAGFYTRTAGRPLAAARHLLAAVRFHFMERGVDPVIMGVGTTGAGRKFVGSVLGADLVVDEITAHARAAVEHVPGVDTILEIGGQDAKFTTLAGGSVTFSAMNSVCAAGTGSFVEEQARRLAVPLEKMSDLAEGHRAPLASDRCTVFMERDINHHLREGYATGELLCSTLHSVCENYLAKVAVERRIGGTICFQGATAKNRALVAAFASRLDRPVHVSRYCHLAGAYGGCLLMADENRRETGFRGFDAFAEPVPVEHEVCNLCTNHCKISVATVAGEQVGYGFLCGRDYATNKRVDANTSGFDLLREHKKAFAHKASRPQNGPVIGIPKALYLFEETGFWHEFFNRLGIATVDSGELPGAAAEGRRWSGAEFCAPMSALHGHIRHLLDRSDHVFLPHYLERESEMDGARRQYCYYTQFAASLGAGLGEPGRILTPLVHATYRDWRPRYELFRMLQEICEHPPTPVGVSRAWDAAGQWLEKRRDLWLREFEDNFSPDRVNAVLLGRPYTTLSRSMGQGVPDLFGAKGVPCFSMDMVPEPEDTRELDPLLREIPWHYASRVLKTALAAARTPGLYPVLVTSFKCSPDSFVQDYVRELLDAYGKPYLVLQLDEHDSNVGYETRVEAAVRAFTNHLEREKAVFRRVPHTLVPERVEDLSGKTLLMPNWDPVVMPLVAAALSSAGVDAIPLTESPDIIRRAMRHNTGQCIPLNIIAEEAAHTIREHGLSPSKTAVWTAGSRLACNLDMFPHHIRTLLCAKGGGLEETGIYTGDLSFRQASPKLPLRIYTAFLTGGLLRRMVCRTRPHEVHAGDADSVAEWALERLAGALSNGGGAKQAMGEVAAAFADIAVDHEPRPLVGIFGDLYVRDNEVMNQDLVRRIEQAGGEAIPVSYTDYVKIIAGPYFRRWLREGRFGVWAANAAFLTAASAYEPLVRKQADPVLGARKKHGRPDPDKVLEQYGVRVEHSGESLDNLLKAHTLAEEHPGLRLFVQVSPAFCCPSLVTEAMSRRIAKNTGVPVVSVTYDGATGDKNEVVVPYVEYAGRGSWRG
ncbi:MAG: acyl-CoA dehydratase activase [Desulfatibacillaceae bacterium]